MKSDIEKVLSKILNKDNFEVIERLNSFTKDNEIKILIFASKHEINKVESQYPQLVSLLLNVDTLELHPQVFGGMGGRSLYRYPDLNDPKEKYLAMVGIKIPFRKPKQSKENVLTAIEKFAYNWKKIICNCDTLKYSDIVNYDKIRYEII